MRCLGPYRASKDDARVGIRSGAAAAECYCPPLRIGIPEVGGAGLREVTEKLTELPLGQMHGQCPVGNEWTLQAKYVYPLLQPDSTASTGTTAIWFTVWFIHPTEDLSLIQVSLMIPTSDGRSTPRLTFLMWSSRFRSPPRMASAGKCRPKRRHPTTPCHLANRSKLSTLAGKADQPGAGLAR
jgi:hypothetical protein